MKVTYTPADGSPAVTIASVTPAASAAAVAQVDGVVSVDYKARDFLIKVGDLARNGTPITPARGDTITEIDPDTDATLGVYTVMLPDPSSPPWRWMDTARRIRRIHTKETAVGS